MKASRALALALVFSVVGVVSSFGVEAPPVLILISLDGFRWDYLDLVETPNLNRLAVEGVRARGLIPVYPSKTFPSHYSIVTGLYPGQHGIVSNNMVDPKIDAEFHLHDRDAVQDGRWWGGEPIWVTAEKQGLISACLFWPGSEAEIAGVRPTYWEPYDGNKSYPMRVQQVLGWLDLPEAERPRMMTLYFQDPNDTSHVYGPEAPETFASIRTVDARIGDLVGGIEERGLSDRVNLIVVSDHGMAEVSPERIVYIDDYVSLLEGELFEGGAILQIYPQRGRKKRILKALRGADPRLAVYSSKEIPEGYHLRGNPRTPPILGVPDVGWEVTVRGSEREQALESGLLMGDHGQNPLDLRMHGVFVAYGPAFRSGLVIDRFENVEIYNLMARVLDVDPAPNDGDLDILQAILALDP